MADSVKITLSLDERQEDIPFPHRELVLDKKNNSILIGRSSKVETKGLVSLPSNAWFRSPVMSRNHAEIVANLDDRKVMIKDLGSLHGTFVNDDKDRLEKGELREIRDGDKLKLGVSIYRGTDSFPPTTLDVGIEYRERRHDVPTSTFQVPDCSDVEDCYSSDSNSDIEEIGGHSIPTTTGPVIDLTELPPKMACSQVIDLSSPPPRSPLSVVALDESSSVFDFPIGSPVPDQALAPEQSLRVASPDLSITGPYHDGSSDYESSVHPSTDDEDEEMMGRHKFLFGDTGSDDEAASDSSGLSDAEAYFESERTDESESYDEDVRDEDESSSEDEEDTGLTFPDEAFRSGFWDETPAKFVTSKPQPLESPKAVKSSQLEIRKLLNDEKESCSSYSEPTVFTPIRTTPPDGRTSTQLEKPKITAAVLGGKIGKEEFFAAREYNKFLVEIQGAAEPRSSVHSLCNEGPFSLASVSTMGQFLKNDKGDVQDPAPILQLPDMVWPEPAKLAVSAEPVGTVQSVEANEPAQPAEPVVSDDTIASTLSKRSSEKALADDASTGRAMDQLVRRSHLGISDIVEVSLPTPAPIDQGTTAVVSSKRKADEISSSTVQEEHWASERLNAEQEVIAVSDSTQPRPAVEDKSSASVPEDLVSREIDCRPAKRLRHIAERVGYAALGGVTAGAMIFGTLVYTAPTFV